MAIVDLAEAVVPDAKVEFVGIRPGEKIHEALISEEEARYTVEMADMYVIRPSNSWLVWDKSMVGKNLPDGFRYTSENNPLWLTCDDLRSLADKA